MLALAGALYALLLCLAGRWASLASVGGGSSTRWTDQRPLTWPIPRAREKDARNNGLRRKETRRGHSGDGKRHARAHHHRSLPEHYVKKVEAEGILERSNSSGRIYRNPQKNIYNESGAGSEGEKSLAKKDDNEPLHASPLDQVPVSPDNTRPKEAQVGPKAIAGVYYINLDSRADRRRYMEAMLQKKTDLTSVSRFAGLVLTYGSNGSLVTSRESALSPFAREVFDGHLSTLRTSTGGTSSRAVRWPWQGSPWQQERFLARHFSDPLGHTPAGNYSSCSFNSLEHQLIFASFRGLPARRLQGTAAVWLSHLSLLQQVSLFYQCRDVNLRATSYCCTRYTGPPAGEVPTTPGSSLSWKMTFVLRNATSITRGCPGSSQPWRSWILTGIRSGWIAPPAYR